MTVNAACTNCIQISDGSRDLRLRSGVSDVQSRHPLNTRIQPHIAEVVASSLANCAGELMCHTACNCNGRASPEVFLTSARRGSFPFDVRRAGSMSQVDPNSVLGEAINYMFNRWQELTLFLRQPGDSRVNPCDTWVGFTTTLGDRTQRSVPVVGSNPAPANSG